jgi:hypothetical protein
MLRLSVRRDFFPFFFSSFLAVCIIYVSTSHCQYVVVEVWNCYLLNINILPLSKNDLHHGLVGVVTWHGLYLYIFLIFLRDISTLFGEEEGKGREMVETWWEGPERSRANQ